MASRQPQLRHVVSRGPEHSLATPGSPSTCSAPGTSLTSVTQPSRRQARPRVTQAEQRMRRPTDQTPTVPRCHRSLSGDNEA